MLSIKFTRIIKKKYSKFITSSTNKISKKT